MKDLQEPFVSADASIDLSESTVRRTVYFVKVLVPVLCGSTREFFTYRIRVTLEHFVILNVLLKLFFLNLSPRYDTGLYTLLGDLVMCWLYRWLRIGVDLVC
jgi:hypothetical protein